MAKRIEVYTLKRAARVAECAQTARDLFALHTHGVDPDDRGVLLIDRAALDAVWPVHGLIRDALEIAEPDVVVALIARSIKHAIEQSEATLARALHRSNPSIERLG